MNEETVVGIVWLAILGLIGAAILWFVGFNFGQRYDGSVNVYDCTTTENVKDGSWASYFHKFYCTGGFCEAVATDSNGHCETLYLLTEESSQSR